MLVAVVTPDYASLKEAAAEGGWACDSNEEVRSAVLGHRSRSLELCEDRLPPPFVLPLCHLCRRPPPLLTRAERPLVSIATWQLAKKPEAKKFILQKMIEEGKAAKLKTFELPQAVFLEGSINDLNQGFSIDNDCLTPTFKLKRPQLLKRYQAQVDEMYTALGEDPAKAFASLSQK